MSKNNLILISIVAVVGLLFLSKKGNNNASVNGVDATPAEIEQARKLQATLFAIDKKIPVFFNITQYQELGLVKEKGKRADGKTNWVLTPKAKKFLTVYI